MAGWGVLGSAKGFVGATEAAAAAAVNGEGSENGLSHEEEKSIPKLPLPSSSRERVAGGREMDRRWSIGPPASRISRSLEARYCVRSSEVLRPDGVAERERVKCDGGSEDVALVCRERAQLNTASALRRSHQSRARSLRVSAVGGWEMEEDERLCVEEGARNWELPRLRFTLGEGLWRILVERAVKPLMAPW